MGEKIMIMKKGIISCIIAAILVMAVTIGMGSMFTSRAAQDDGRIWSVCVASDDGFCNLRTGPGTDYSVIQPIYNGNYLDIYPLTVSSYDGLTWGHTYYNGREGWISMGTTRVISVEKSSWAEYDVRVTEPDYIYLRQGPGSEYPSLYRPYKGQILRITHTMVNPFDARPWGETTINGITGWVSLDWTYRDSSAIYNRTDNFAMDTNRYSVVVETDTGTIPLKENPGYAYAAKTWVSNGTSLDVVNVVNIPSEDTVWGWVNYAGYSGWIPMNYTRVVDITNAVKYNYFTSVVESSNIRLRLGPGTEFREVVSYIPNDTTLKITAVVINSFDGRPWGRTYYNGYEGWVSLDWTYRAPGR